jgi:hypothetical protein
MTLTDGASAMAKLYLDSTLMLNDHEPIDRSAKKGYVLGFGPPLIF